MDTDHRTNEESDVTTVRTFLIADVRGYTRFTLQHGDMAAARLAGRFAEIAQACVQEWGGDVIELRGDEALAVFTSTRQALRAAVELQNRFAKAWQTDPSLPLRVGIGLDAGEAVPVDGGYRGAALNLAARLCSLAGPGEALASETVVSLARKVDGLSYSDRGMAQVKGFADPLRVFAITVESGADSAPASDQESADDQLLLIGGFLGTLPANALVGREDEMGRARSAIDAALGGVGQLLLLAGEPGAGKTRLAQEITVDLRNRGFLIAAGGCYEPQGTVPFYPFIDALSALYAAAPPSLRENALRLWPDLARLLPSLGIPLADGSGQQDQQRLFWAVTGFVEAVAAETPVALLLDDLHWVDAASLDLLHHLARHTRGAQVLLLGTYRGVEVNRAHPLEAALRDLTREGLMQRIDVRRLGLTETSDLMAAVLGEEEVSGDFAQLVYARTEGNPFFVGQVLRVLVERGDVFRRDGRWDRKGIQEIEVPESVRSVVGQRLTRLTEETQEILREASVLGQTFRFDDLEAMTERPERDLERALDEATGAGMVREVGRDRYGFDHALTQGSLYAELSSRRRRRLHLAAGEAIEHTTPSEPQRRVAELAWHFQQADDPVRAMLWSMRAGDAAQEVFAHSDAEYHYRVARELASEQGKAASEAEALDKLGHVLFAAGRSDEARVVLGEAIQIYQRLADFEGEMRATAQLGWVLADGGRRDEGIAILGSILERWRDDAQRSSSAAASLHIALANLYWLSGRHDRALPLTETAIELAQGLGDDRLRAAAEARRATIFLMMGRSDEALGANTRAIDLAEAAGELQTLSRALVNRAILHDINGRRDLAMADRARNLDVSRQIGGPTQIAWSLFHPMWGAWDLEGDGGAARRYAREIFALDRRIRGTRCSGFSIDALHILALSGEASREQLEKLVHEVPRMDDPNRWINGQAALGQWDVLEDRAESARDRIGALLDDPAVEDQFRAYYRLTLVRALISLGELDEAERLAQLSQEEIVRGGPPNIPYHVHSLLGSIRALQGRSAEARTLFDKALANPWRGWSRGWFLYEYGCALIGLGDKVAARARLEESLASARHMGAKPDIARVEKALRDLSRA